MAKKKLTSDEQMAGVLSYISILFLIPLLAIKKKSEFTKFHIRQGIVLFVATLIVWVIFNTLFFWFFFSLMYVINVLIFIVMIVAIVKALNGEMWKIPWLGNFIKNVPKDWVK